MQEIAIFFNTDENDRGNDGAEAKIKLFENRFSWGRGFDFLGW